MHVRNHLPAAEKGTEYSTACSKAADFSHTTHKGLEGAAGATCPAALELLRAQQGSARWGGAHAFSAQDASTIFYSSG